MSYAWSRDKGRPYTAVYHLGLLLFVVTGVALGQISPVGSAESPAQLPLFAPTPYTGFSLAEAIDLATASARNGTVPNTMIRSIGPIRSASKLVFTSQPAATTVGERLNPAPIVTIENANGDVISNSHVPVTLQLGSNPMGGRIAGTLTINAVNGVASFPDLLLNAPATGYTLIATSPSYLPAISKSFKVYNAVIELNFPTAIINVGSILPGLLTLSSPITSALTVALSTSSTSFIELMQPLVVIQPGQTSARFTIKGVAPGGATLATSATGYSQAMVSVTVVPAMKPTTLRQAAAQRGFLIGAVADADEFGYFDPLTGSPQYAATLRSEYNMVEGENAMKWIVTEPSQDVYNFEPGDEIATFALANQMMLRGHNLAWWRQNPDWLNTLANTAAPATMSQLLHDHIFTEMRHYKGKVFAWDVVNEAVSDSSNGPGTQLRDGIWYNAPGIGLVGTGWIEQAFRWAHEADPNALLFYNDYNIYTPGGKTQAVLNMIADFKSRGVPIDGVGLQMHTDTYGWPDSNDLAATIKSFTDLGIQVHITEVDVQVPVNAPTTAGTSTPGWLQLQAQTYQRLLTVCLQNPGCTAF